MGSKLVVVVAVMALLAPLALSDMSGRSHLLSGGMAWAGNGHGNGGGNGNAGGNGNGDAGGNAGGNGNAWTDWWMGK